ncbi:MAG TPA: cupredoxin domain-containing protein [Candidatus Limnocylindria bacterium]|nr:cupredoxin domain-containing protein [Candidatus Limnocylindria bacterium]
MGRLRLLRGPWLVAPIAALSLVLLVAWAPAPVGTSGVTHDVKVATFQFGFTPNVIRANLGDEILIHLTSRDVSHGFYLDGYGIEVRVEAGQTKDIRFTANRAGTYRFRCAVTCGALHPFMIGQLVVEPNVPFAAAAAVVAGSAVAGYVWSVRRREETL